MKYIKYGWLVLFIINLIYLLLELPEWDSLNALWTVVCNLAYLHFDKADEIKELKKQVDYLDLYS